MWSFNLPKQGDLVWCPLIPAQTPSPAKATERELKENASEAQRLGKEGGAEAKARGKEAVKDFGSSVQNTTDQWQRAGDDVVGGLKKEAQDVAKPADDLLKKTRDEGREAVSEAKDQYKVRTKKLQWKWWARLCADCY